MIRNYFIPFLFLACSVSNAFGDGHEVEYGTEAEAQEMLERVVAIMKFNKIYALNAIAEGKGGFLIKDLYAFCANSKGTLTAHPVAMGRNLKNFVDSEGTKVGELFYQNAQAGKFIKVDYKLARLTTGDETIVSKTAIVTKIADHICAVGFHNK